MACTETAPKDQWVNEERIYDWLVEKIPVYRLTHGVVIRYTKSAETWARSFGTWLKGTGAFKSMEVFATDGGPDANVVREADVLVAGHADVESISALKEGPSATLRSGGIIALLSPLGPTEDINPIHGDLRLIGEETTTGKLVVQAYSKQPVAFDRRSGFGVRILKTVYGVLEPGMYGFPLGKWSMLVGRSGVGKTTLLNMIANVGPSSIKTRINPPTSLFFLPQDPDVIGGVSVRTNIGLFSEGADAAERVASQLGLEKVLDRVVGTLDEPLSGGEHQRVALAQALAARPPVLLLDEPFSGVDHIRRWQMMRHFKEVVATEPAIATVLCVAHDFHLIEKFFEYVFEIVNGQLYRMRKPI